MNRPLVALTAGQPELEMALKSLSLQWNLPVVSEDTEGAELLLVLTAERLELYDTGTVGQGPVYADFVGGTSAHRRRFGGGRGQPLAKAIGLKHGRSPLILDATAGLGRDAFVLASLGCELVMLERSPVIAALLHNGLKRALADPEIHTIACRMRFFCTDAVDYLTGMVPSQQPDVIYMDPMYPHRDKSALVKKEMRLFRRIRGEDGDSAALLSAARQNASHRVVVKRPVGAEWVGGEKPTMAIKSPNTRYDVYMNNGF